MVWDPVEEIILWTDHKKKGIFYAKFSQDRRQWIEKPMFLRKNFSPRGLAIDYCRR